ncbi:hypothetical protein MKX03_019725 [Papaver bracteatum]|nr:hypothetical protein MKX03_019725 [Papaver bracteatum]
MVFIGDSLNYNMYTSLSCIFWNAIPDKTRISKPSGKTEFKSRGDFSLTFEASLINFTSFFILDVIDEVESSVYRDAAVVVLDSFHWWVPNNYLHPQLEMIKAYKKGLTTWRKWIDKSIQAKPKLFSEDFPKLIMWRWNTGGKCNLEAEPITSNTTYVQMSPPHVKILEDTLLKMKTPVLYLNVSKLTYYRADGHPSVCAKNYTVQERIVALDHQDCSHWCLPGVPDTWNELLYLSLLKASKGSFSR